MSAPGACERAELPTIRAPTAMSGRRLRSASGRARERLGLREIEAAERLHMTLPATATSSAFEEARKMAEAKRIL